MNAYLFFFLCLFFLRRFFRLCVAILCLFLFLPQGILPEALATIPQVSLRTLHINLAELIQHMPGKKEIFATTPLAELVQDQQGIRSNADI